jgi:pimeloyl-ACP methyl ester carboxylesterase
MAASSDALDPRFPGDAPVVEAARPPSRLVDEDTPGRMDSLSFPSHGVDLFARVFVPAGLPRGGVVLLHGLPGAELNFDLAHALRRAGFVVLLPHYRGSWGMAGSYSLANVVADAGAAVQCLRSTRFGLDYGPVRSTILVGHSMGGFAALMAGAELGADRVASLAGFNCGGYAAARRHDPGALAETAEAWAGFVQPLQGTSAESLAREVLRSHSDWNLVNLAAAYRGRPVLLACAEQDDVAPPPLHHNPLALAFRTAGVRLTERRLDAEHGFVDARLELARMLVAWLAE